MKLSPRLKTVTAAILVRCKVGTFSIQLDERAGIMTIETGDYVLTLNCFHSVLMIHRVNSANDPNHSFNHWRNVTPNDAKAMGLDPGWWYFHKSAIWAILDLIDGSEPPPAVENTAELDKGNTSPTSLLIIDDPPAQVEPAGGGPPADDLCQFQMVVNVTMRGVAQQATV